MEPANLSFAKTHEWVLVDNGTATIGISDFAVKELTDLVFVELPPIGSTLAVGKPFGVVESVKAAADLYAPIAGEVIEINEALPDSLDLLSDDPFGRGWMVKLKLAESTSLAHLMDYAAYCRHCESESH